MKPNFIVILIDDLRYDEFGAAASVHRTPNVDRLAPEGALFERAFHTTPICSPNRARSSPANTRAGTASSTMSRATR